MICGCQKCRAGTPLLIQVDFLAFVLQPISVGRCAADAAESICMKFVKPKPSCDQRAAYWSVVPIRTLNLRVSHDDQRFPLFAPC